LLLAAPAWSATVTDRPLLFSFDGSDTTAGKFSKAQSLAIDDAAGSLYVLDSGKKVVDKFNLAGEAQNFVATGTSSLDGSATPQGVFPEGDPWGDIAVDNSGGANQGNIFVSGQGSAPLNAFDSGGDYLWQIGEGVFGYDCGIAVDASGHLWVGDEPAHQAREFDNAGSPPAQIGEVTDTSGSERPCRVGLDAGGNLYIVQEKSQVDKYVGGVFASTIDAASTNDVTIDQSSGTGHIFTVHEEDFSEFDSAGASVGTFGANSFDEALGIAYDKTLDRVYVADTSSGAVEVFGPEATGTVPDPTLEPTSEIGVSKAKFNGKVNPQSVSNSYFFEWKPETGANGWGAAKSSPPQSLPEDSSDHAVSFEATGLAGNTTYQVRLVGTNTENDLRGVSGLDTFTTTSAAAAPEAFAQATSALTTTTALLHGAVNPQEDFGTTYRFQTSTDPACASDFSDRPLRNLESEANAPVGVSEGITGLLPVQHYCVRVVATNSGGETTSETTEFTTKAAPPDQLFTAFAAPRTDTSARLNARLNPEGAPLTYHFEYSEDGGATWLAMPEEEDTSEAREQIVVGSELDGLTPDTTYSYRFVAENEPDPEGEPGVTVVVEGGEKTFRTRTIAEMTPPQRGYELVNNPDKGNQHATVLPFPDSQLNQSPISPDGEKAIWTTRAGAPGGTTSTEVPFLATRTPSGWKSKALVPPAEEQVGSGSDIYYVQGASSDYSRFLFAAVEPHFGGNAPPTLVRLDEEGNQQILHQYSQEAGYKFLQMTDDTDHVLLVDPITHQIEDIGSGIPEAVSVMPDGLPNACGLSEEGQSFGRGIDGADIRGSGVLWKPGYNRVSATDASRVYFEAVPNGEPCGGLPSGFLAGARLALYVRNRGTEETTLIDPGTAAVEPRLIRATTDGRSVFFATESQLDPSDSNEDVDVYRWDEAPAPAGTYTCLTCVVPDAKVLTAGGFKSVLVSSDFSHVYFESEEQLVPGQGKQGDANVYALSEGEIRFVADPNRGDGVLGAEEAQLSADGKVLAFATGDSSMGHFQLTADSLDEGNCLNKNGNPDDCVELFRYDDSDGSLECISCSREGLTTHALGGPAAELGLQRFRLSADGSTIAFLTAEALVPQDINNSFDVYEWRDGAVRLITDGETTFPFGPGSPVPIDADRDGSDIFFKVAAPGLTGFEQDGLANLYDARIGGGFEAPSPPVHCAEETCQGPLEAAPGQQQSASSSFSGRGNVNEGQTRRRCTKGKVRRQGRCVRRHQSKRHHHKRASHANQGRTK